MQSTDIKTSTGVSLSGEQKVLVGSVLDVCFAPFLSYIAPWRCGCFNSVERNGSDIQAITEEEQNTKRIR